MRRTAIALVLIAATTLAVRGQRPSHGPLFPPEYLGLLESPDRDEWQQPERVMDAMLIADGSKVADIGAGGGWFTIRLARRVGPNGIVYAEDVQQQMLDSIARRVSDQRLANVKVLLGTMDDPRLPLGLNAVLIVDTYPQLGDPVAFLRNTAKTLAPNGRIGVVDFKTDGPGGPGPPINERLAPDVVRRDAEEAGLRLVGDETFLRYQVHAGVRALTEREALSAANRRGRSHARPAEARAPRR